MEGKFYVYRYETNVSYNCSDCCPRLCLWRWPLLASDMRGRKRKNDIPSSEAENVVSLYKNKISLKQIAFDYDVTAYVVRHLLVDMGVKIARRGRRKVKKTEAIAKPFKSFDLFEGYDYKAASSRAVRELTKPLGEDNAER